MMSSGKTKKYEKKTPSFFDKHSHLKERGYSEYYQSQNNSWTTFNYHQQKNAKMEAELFSWSYDIK